MSDITLPELPLLERWEFGYTAEDMQAYASAAVEADRAGRVGEREVLETYRKLHEGKLGAHWLWVVIEQIAAGIPEPEAMREFGYYETPGGAGHDHG